MAKLIAVVSVIAGLILGIAITWLGTDLMGIYDQQLQILIAIVLSIFAAMSFYFLTKGSGSS